MLGGDAFRMELYAMHRQAFVRGAHHKPVGLGGDRKRAGKRCAIDHQRVIARRPEWPVDAAKHALALVRHLGELAVHRHRRAHHVAAERLADRLQTETHAEHRDGGGRLLDEVEADAGFVGRAGAGREHDRVRVGADDVGGRYLVVAMHDDVRPKLAEVMDEVEGEAVVVVDQDNHAPGQRFRAVLRGGGEGVKRRTRSAT